MKNKAKLFAVISLLFVGTILIVILNLGRNKKTSTKKSDQVVSLSTPILSPSSTPTPTPKPLTFAEMNLLYGPCAKVPTLMYHHIQSEEVAKKLNQGGLSTDPKFLKLHLAYLKEKGYQVIAMRDLIYFFNLGSPLPKKPVLLTFDDGYKDFYSNALPILREFNNPATLFLPTGLVENPGYLSWSEVNEIGSSGLILIANHTWSHKSTASDKNIIEKEISLADRQLEEKSLNREKVFAYPYGSDSLLAENYLRSLNYNLAFTTHPGSILCKKLNLSLPRVRVGNVQLNFFGI